MNQLVLAATKAEIACLLPLGPHPGLPPSTVTATVYDHTGAELVAAASQTVVSWATSGAITSGDTTFAVSSWSTSRVPQPGEELLLSPGTTPDRAVRERVIVRSVSGTTVTPTQPLELSHASGVGVYPVTQFVVLTATHTATKGRNCRVRLSVALNGATTTAAPQTAETLYDVVAQIPICTLTETRIRPRAPVLYNDLSGWTDYSGGGWGHAIDTAWDRVCDDLWGHAGLPVDLLVASSQLEEAAYWKLCAMAAESVHPTGWDSQAWLDHCERKYTDAKRTAFSAIVWIDENQDLTPTPSNTNQRRLDWSLSL